MEQNTKKEINIVDLWQVFTKNVVLLIVIALVGAIICGAVGGVLAYVNVSYETTLKFSVSPTDDTDALLYNLQSEAFAEKLLLEENGLPEKSECDPEDYAAALAAIEAFNAAREQKRALRREYNRLQITVVEYQMKYYDQEYAKIFEQLSTYKSAPSETIANDESHKAMINKLESELSDIIDERSKFIEETYNPVMLHRADLQEKLNLASYLVNDTRREAEALTEKVLAPWREREEVQSKIQEIVSSVSYEYAKLETTETTTASKNEEQNKGYIKIYVSVDKDEELAKEIVDGLKRCVGPFVVKHIEEVTSSVQVDCMLISTVSAPTRVGDNVIVKAATFAVIGGIALFAVTYIVLLFKKLFAIYMVADAEQKKQDVIQE
ncbi:MAG: hypothetical protein IJW65_06070 [Clostridia bacterium]|nr:hypothetical protein [Clostridia bacterium]